MVEIDFLPASSEKKGADSILIRFGEFNYSNLPNRQTVILIDGGFKETARTIIDHVRQVYRSSVIDCVINTHPDADHIQGLIELLTLNELQIGYFLVHDPWKHSYGIARKSRASFASVQSRLDYNLAVLDDLLQLIDERKIQREVEPFAGVEFRQCLKLLGPSAEYYEHLVKQFPGMHEERSVSHDGEPQLVDYNPDNGHFLRNPITTARNDSSVISQFECDGLKVLFTGDAGTPSIDKAMLYAKSNQIDITLPNYLQLPHHGSIKNISWNIFDSIKPRSCVVSAPSDSEKHPSRLILNFATHIMKIQTFHVWQSKLRLSINAPDRPGWSNATSVGVFPKVYIPTFKE